MLGLQNEREWQLFCDKVLLQPELATDPRFDANARRNEHRAALEGHHPAGVRRPDRRPGDRAARRGADRQRAHEHAWPRSGPIRSCRRAGGCAEVGSPAGELPALLPPAANSRFDYRMDPIPAIGEHTQAILRELGRSEAEIAALQAAGAI